ncbi:MAG: hypothetical protein QG657_14, partial [Acidobacteriota bacterium]|nr:hypothetical protein [Acidobacteriota bacterium]
MKNRDLRELKIAAAQYPKEKDYWLNIFSGEPVRSCFPSSLQKTGLPPRQMETMSFEMDDRYFTQLMNLSKHNDHALHIILLTALTTLLNRYTDNEDITIGTPIYQQKTKTGAEVEFINTVLPIRNRLHHGMTFKELLVQVKKVVLEAVAYQAFPVELLPELLNLPVSHDVFPIFDNALVLENIQDNQYLEHINLNMVFHFLRSPENIKISINYNTLCWETSTIERIITHFNCLLQNALSNMDLPLYTLEMLTAEERRKILTEFNNTAANYPQDKTIHQLFEEQVQKTPDNVGLVGDVGQLRQVGQVGQVGQIAITYRQLNEQANHLAGLLIEKGIAAEDIVGLKIDRSVEMIACILAILKAGGAYMPIDPEYPRERIEYMLKDSGTRILINKSEIRNPKSETNPNETNSNDQNKNQYFGAAFVLDFEHLNFDTVSN